MTKLEELINELCPDGVEYFMLEDITKAVNIGINPRKFFKLNPSDATGFYVTVRELNGLQGVIQTEKTDTINDEAISIIQNRANIEIGDILFSNTGTVGKMALVIDTPRNWGVNEGIYVIKPNNKIVDSRYLYYYLASNLAYKQYSKKFTGSTLKHVTQKALMELQIPLPPLSIQSEIVHILDSFTLLTAELTTELTARQKQYAFYRDYLLNFSDEDVTKKIPDIDCSNIKYVKLGDIAKFTYGYTDKAKDYGDARFIRITDILDNGYLNPNDAKYINLNEESKKYLLSKGDLLLARTGATYGKTLYVPNDEKAVYASFLIKIELDNTKILNRYYWHFSKSNLYWKQANKLVSTAGQPQFNINAVSRVVIPVPPLSVQENIVKILDRFDKLNNDMSEGLPAEIEARKKQYEYYRDTLLSFDDKACSHIVKVERERELTRTKAIKWLELQDVLKIKNGKDYKSFNAGNYPVYGSGGIMAYVDTFAYDKPSVLIPRKGSIDKLYYVDVPFWNVDTIFYTDINNEIVLTKYVYYWLQKEHLEKLNTAGGVPSLTQTVLNKVKIAVPPLEEQERIVSILDRFDKLCNDISEGLPAEIEARQKQYEFYRDKLLMFKRVEANEK